MRRYSSSSGQLWALACAPSVIKTMDFAVVSALCHHERTTLTKNTAGAEGNLIALGRSLKVEGLHRILLVKNIPSARMTFQRQAWDEVIDVVSEQLHFSVAHAPGGLRLWPYNGTVQRRPDGSCTVVKLNAWKLVAYSGILLIDYDVCNVDVPAVMPFMHRALASKALLVAPKEVVGRTYFGINTHFMFLRPSLPLFDILKQKAKHGDFMPYTNTEQDVIETVFSPREADAVRRRLGGFPKHVHSHSICLNASLACDSRTTDCGDRSPRVLVNKLLPLLGCSTRGICRWLGPHGVQLLLLFASLAAWGAWVWYRRRAAR